MLRCIETFFIAFTYDAEEIHVPLLFYDRQVGGDCYHADCFTDIASKFF